MEITDFARMILFGSTLEDKLTEPDLQGFREQLLSQANSFTPPALDNLPKFPSRPQALSFDRKEKSRFPELARIHEPQTRGEILHFFGNHELLALELMALLLLKYPDAPASFRLGIARTMSEEQGHLKLYIARMQELGVQFGDLPVNGYFWQVLSPMRSPLEFVTQMSLTFEQANLDFSLFYRDEVAKTGDAQTTQVLDQVYREEIGHVKHGLEWFNRWRKENPSSPSDESDWDAYRRLLPPPLTPRRAKGLIFDFAARKQAGFSETYIRELELFSGAKGRPPVLWLYNPFCDSEIARGKPGFSPKAAPKRLAEDLEHLPMYLASPQDIVLVSKKPGLEWQSAMKQSGFDIPEWGSRNGAEIREPKFGGFEPWGWSPESFEYFRPLKARLAKTSGGNAAWCESLFSSHHFSDTEIGSFFSKAWSVEFFRQWLDENPDKVRAFGCDGTVGRVFSDWQTAKAYLEEKLEKEERTVAKAPWSTSGNGVRRILNSAELDGPLGGWIQNIVKTQGSVIIEPWLDKMHDLSIQLEIEQDQIRILEARKFLIGNQFEYRGTLLGPLRESFDSASLRLLQEVLPSWKSLARDLSIKLRSLGYQGPVGIDAMIYRTPSDELRFKPIVEINPRWTMGRIALALEKRILPGTPAAWIFLPWRELREKGYESPAEFALFLANHHSLETVQTTAGTRVRAGVIPTQDPSQANEVLTLLFVGEKAVQSARELMCPAD